MRLGLALGVLVFLPACKIGFGSFASKPVQLQTAPLPPRGPRPIASKFVVETVGNATSEYDIGLCVGPVSVKTYARNGAEATVRENTEVALAGFAANQLFYDAACTRSVPTRGAVPFVVIEASTSFVNVFVKSSQVAAPTFTASSTGFTPGAKVVRMIQTVRGFGISNLENQAGSATGQVGAGFCAPYFLNSFDGVGNIFNNSAANIAVTVGTSLGLLFRGSDPTCSDTGQTSLTFNPSSGNRRFYFKSSQINSTAQLSGQSQFPTSGTLLSIVAAAIDFQFLSPISSETQVLGLCKAYSIQMLDINGNPISPFSTQNFQVTAARVDGITSPTGTGGTTHTNSNCTGTGNFSVSPSSTTGTFYYRSSNDVVDGTQIRFTVTNTTMGGNKVSFPVTLIAQARSIATTFLGNLPKVLETCNGPIDAFVSDGRQSNTKPYVGPTITLGLSSTTVDTSKRKFWRNRDCSNEIVGGAYTLASGESTARFYYTDITTLPANQIYTLVLTVEGPPITGATNATGSTGTLAFRNPLELDAGFGNGGKIVHNVNDLATAFAATPYGTGYVVAGQSDIGGVVHVTLARYTANGRVDHTFGNSGIRYYAIPNYESSQARAVLINGSSIYVAGTAYSTVGTDSFDYFVLKFNINATNTPTVTTGKFVSSNLNNIVNAMTISGTTLALAGTTGSFSGSTKDFGFATHSLSTLAPLVRTSIPFQLSGSAVLSEAKGISVSGSEYFIGGGAGTRFAVASISSSGTVSCQANPSQGVTLTAGQIAVAGNYLAGRNTSGNIVLTRFNNCAPDVSFGTANGQYTDPLAGNNSVFGLAMNPASADPAAVDAEKIYVVGSVLTGGNNLFKISRYKASGLPDYISDTSKYRSVQNLAGDDNAYAVLVQGGGTEIFSTGAANGNFGSALFQR